MSLTPTRTPTRLDALDGLRGIAALAIVVLHVWMFDFGDAGKPPKTAADLAIGELRLGVPLFFVLSGFFVHRAFVAAALEGRRRPRLRHYALRRAARILPAYWLTLALSFVLLRAAGHPLAIDASQLPAFLVFVQSWFPEIRKHLDPPMWTLGVEIGFYAVLPVIALPAMRLSRRGQAAVCAGVVAVGSAVVAGNALGSWPAVVALTVPFHLAAFGAGMLVVTLTHGRRAAAQTGRLLLVAGVLLVVFDGVWHSLALGPQVVRDVAGDLPACVGFALVVASCALTGRRARVLGSTPARWAGTLSYGVYLLHFVVIVVLRAEDAWPRRLDAALALVLAITLASAAVCWFAVERPVLRWVARRTGGHRRAPARGAATPRPAGAAA
jgi:peptidoglycan/LPS O-acetylase OafA/YrhL